MVAVASWDNVDCDADNVAEDVEAAWAKLSKDTEKQNPNNTYFPSDLLID